MLKGFRYVFLTAGFVNIPQISGILTLERERDLLPVSLTKHSWAGVRERMRDKPAGSTQKTRVASSVTLGKAPRSSLREVL